MGWLCAVALGAASFALNGIPISAGWRVEFLFGSIVPLLALRLLTGPQVVFAVSLGALRTVLLWNHPYAWLVWTAEACVIARYSGRSSPVRADVLFWLLAGAPLLWLTYGLIMETETSVLTLVILKQALNAVLNLALAELGYACWYIAVMRTSGSLQLRRVRLESLILSTMACVTILPAILFMRLDAPNRQGLIEARMDLRLSKALLEADKQLATQGLPTDPQTGLTDGNDHPAVLIVSPSGAVQKPNGWQFPDWVEQSALRSPENGEMAILPPPHSFGMAAMNAAKESIFTKAKSLPRQPGVRLIAVVQPLSEIARQQVIQAQILAALGGMLPLMTLIAFVLAQRSKASLERISEAVSDLAALGQSSQSIRSMVVEEFGEMARSVSHANSQMERELEVLAVSRRRLNSIATHAPLVIYSLELVGHHPGRVSFVSPSIESVLGYEATETLIEGWWEQSLHPDDQQSCMAANEHLYPGKIITQEYRIRHKLGHYVWIYDCLAIDEGGAEGVGILIDMTDKKLASDKLIQANKMESLGRMAAGVAHELNQPLNFIRLAAQNLKLRAENNLLDQIKATEKLELILTQVERAALIVEEVRTFGRSDKGRAESVSVDRVIREVIDLLSVQLTMMDIDLEYRPDASNALVLAQPTRLTQVLINLILNARDAIEARRKIEGAIAGTISIRAYQAGEFLKISVDDNGTGISADQINLLFEPFYTTKAPDKGTGLGLSVSYGIIADLGGTIRAESLPLGARFIVSLPNHPG